MKVYELISLLKACNRHAEVEFVHPSVAFSTRHADPILMLGKDLRGQPEMHLEPVYMPIKEVQESEDRKIVLLMDDPEDNINFASVSEPYPL